MSSAADPHGSSQRGNGLERFLALFAEVRSGEAGTVLLLAANVFLILTAYYVMKPVREALILAGGGAELKAYMSAGQTFLLLFTVPIYARIASRVSRRKLINGVTLFFAACLVVFYLLAQFDVPLGIAFYLWVGVFNVTVVAQFWSFANDVYTVDQGKRLFAIVGFGASAGAVLGPFISGWLIDPIGPYQLLLVAGAILGAGLLLTNAVDRRASEGTIRPRDTHSADPSGVGAVSSQVTSEEPMGDRSPYALVFGNKYLLAIAFLILFLNWVNTTGEYILGRVVTEEATRLAALDTAFDKKVFIGKFYSDFFGIVNALSLGIQLFLVSRILKYLGVKIALLLLPLIALGGYLFVVAMPVLGLIRWAKTAENATDYSLQNTLRGVLFLPTTREQKYKAKQAIDTIFVRAGDALSALLVFVGTNYLAFGTAQFAMVNLAFVAVWIVLAIAIGRMYTRISAGGLSAQ